MTDSTVMEPLRLQDHPVQRRQGKLRTKGNAPEVEAVQQNPGLGNGGAPAQDPGDEFKGSDVIDLAPPASNTALPGS